MFFTLVGVIPIYRKPRPLSARQINHTWDSHTKQQQPSTRHSFAGNPGCACIQMVFYMALCNLADKITINDSQTTQVLCCKKHSRQGKKDGSINNSEDC
jgi:hypothetical protein